MRASCARFIPNTAVDACGLKKNKAMPRTRSIWKRCGAPLAIAALCALLPPVLSAQDGAQAGGHDVLRIENEIKLHVPAELKDSVWRYLSDRYANNNLFLKAIDESFNCQFAEEFFVDQYFDDKHFRAMAAGHGVRHRSRLVLSDPHSPKNERELIQVKVNDIDAEDDLSRGEYKYPLPGAALQTAYDHRQPLLRLVKTEYRQDLLQRLKQYGLNARGLYPTIRLEQLRKRVYVSRGIEPFATLTLDEVAAHYAGAQHQFVELELELNEIGFTESDAEARAEMQRINALMQSDLLERFPAITQDQTPKYNKAGLAFGIAPEAAPASSAGAGAAFKYGILGAALVLLAALVFFRLGGALRNKT
jgi:hypothetical protein